MASKAALISIPDDIRRSAYKMAVSDLQYLNSRFFFVLGVYLCFVRTYHDHFATASIGRDPSLPPIKSKVLFV
jgi:hypothetical protein